MASSLGFFVLCRDPSKTLECSTGIPLLVLGVKHNWMDAFMGVWLIWVVTGCPIFYAPNGSLYAFVSVFNHAVMIEAYPPTDCFPL